MSDAQHIIDVVNDRVGLHIACMYKNKFHLASDGCTFSREVVLDRDTGKDIICMMHDWLYYTGFESKAIADYLLFLGYKDTGHPWVAWTRYLFFLLGGGGAAWTQHRAFGHSLATWRRNLINRDAVHG